MVFGMQGEIISQTLRECRASITSSPSVGDGNVLTTMSPVRYNGRVYEGHYVTPTKDSLNCYKWQLN